MFQASWQILGIKNEGSLRQIATCPYDGQSGWICYTDKSISTPIYAHFIVLDKLKLGIRKLQFATLTFTTSALGHIPILDFSSVDVTKEHTVVQPTSMCWCSKSGSWIINILKIGPDHVIFLTCSGRYSTLCGHWSKKNAIRKRDNETAASVSSVSIRCRTLARREPGIQTLWVRWLWLQNGNGLMIFIYFYWFKCICLKKKKKKTNM